jgi:hypothetical protein
MSVWCRFGFVYSCRCGAGFKMSKNIRAEGGELGPTTIGAIYYIHTIQS